MSVLSLQLIELLSFVGSFRSPELYRRAPKQTDIVVRESLKNQTAEARYTTLFHTTGEEDREITALKNP